MPRIYRDKLGIASDPQPLSVDPRLSVAKYDKWKNDFIRKNGAFDEESFSKYIDGRLYAVEQNAIRHQINKLEKL